MDSSLSVSSLLIRVLVEVVQRRGVAPEALLGGGASALFADPSNPRVPLDELQRLLARATQLTAEPALGIHCGLWASESSFGMISPLVSHSQTLRHALALVAQFRGLLSDEVSISLSERAGVAQVLCKLHAAIGRSMAELVVAGLVRMLWSFGCSSAEIQAVRFEHKHPAHHHAYTIAFGGAERFGQPFTGIEFSAQVLDRPHMHWQPELQALIRAQAERALEQLSRPQTYTERVGALLNRRRAPQVPDMAFAARELGVSVRSLRRRLEDEGTSYRELSQSRLSECACSMLRDQEQTLQAIAHALGFTDSPSFHRAFRRWTGSTPLAYRASVLARGPQAPASYEHHR